MSEGVTGVAAARDIENRNVDSKFSASKFSGDIVCSGRRGLADARQIIRRPWRNGSLLIESRSCDDRGDCHGLRSAHSGASNRRYRIIS